MLNRYLVVALLALGACKREDAPVGGDTKTPDTKPTDAKGKPVETPPPPGEKPGIPAPPDVAAPPADAEKTPSGIASKVLTKGTGTVHPQAQDKVKVHYTGWTTDGKMFDSSVQRGQPAEFPLRGVIPGWTEGVQLMVEGEKRLFWIPEELAYKGKKGRPQGMLVFEIELLGITPGPKPIAPPMDIKAAPADAKKDAQGNAYVILDKGKGKAKVNPAATVTLHFTAWKPNGEQLESTHQMGGKENAEAPKVPLDRLPEPWQKVVTDMVEGEKRVVWMTNDTAMGAAGETRVFEFEVLGVTEPPPAPADVKEPPADAVKEKSGLASKVLTKGKGKDHPKASDQVEVHYTGWTTDGKMFDSSVVRGQPARFRLSGVIPGWTEGLQLMVVGEKRRFWIPEELAYKGGGGPQGMLVFDVELLQINPGPEGAKPGK